MVKLVAGSNWANAKSTMKGSTIKKVALKAKSKKEIIELERSKKRKKRSEDKQLKRMTPILDTNRIVAMDCEMVGVGANGERSVLARCSIVDYDGNVLYDQIVQPLEKVTDFRTKYSGIRSKTLRKAISFRECQRQVDEVTKGKILVGHALKNDFQALMFMHPKIDVRDTAKYRPYMKRRGTSSKLYPCALSDLSRIHLSKTIQEGEHDSVEDARTTLELYKREQNEWETLIQKDSKFKGGIIGRAPPAAVKAAKVVAVVEQVSIPGQPDETEIVNALLRKSQKVTPKTFSAKSVANDEFKE